MRRVSVVITVASLALASLACEAIMGTEEAEVPAATTAPTAMAAAATPLPSETEGQPGARSVEVDPCSLLSAEDVEQVYEQDPGQPESEMYDYVALGASPACFWRGVGARITVQVPPQGANPEAFYTELVRRMHPSEPLSGLGDQAWIDPRDGDLLVRSGDVYFLVEHIPFGQGVEPAELTRSLAERALKNLP